MARRIGSIFSQSAYTDARFVIGANGPRANEWPDILYNYFILNLASRYGNKADYYQTNNMEFTNGLSPVHVHVSLLRSQGKHNRATTLIDYIETIRFELYSITKSSGGVIDPGLDDLDYLYNEMQRIFMRYISHDIAGIDIIDNITAGEAIPPQSNTNPFSEVYKRNVDIDIYYNERFLFPLTEDWELNYNGARYPAGAFTREINDPLGV